jgi:hypothetical protein
MRSKDGHHFPHLPALRAGEAILPGIHRRCCNSHFEREVIRGHSVFVELNLNPICHAFHARRQGFRLRWFPCFWREFDRKMPVCKTQQGYSPPLRGGEGEEVADFAGFGGSIRAIGLGEFSPAQAGPSSGSSI